MGASHKFDEHQCLDLLNKAKWGKKMSRQFEKSKAEKLIDDMQFLRGFISGLMAVSDSNNFHSLEQLENIFVSIQSQVLEALSHVD